MGISFDALYGAGEAQAAPAVVYQLAQLDVLATENGDRGRLLTNGTSRPLAVAQMRMTAIWAWGGTRSVRGIVTARFYHCDAGWAGRWEVLADLAIGPEHLSDAVSLAPQAILLPPGEGIGFDANTEDGGGASWISLQVAYYMAEVT